MDSRPKIEGSKTYITDAVPAHKRSVYWQEATSEAFLPLEIECAGDEDFYGYIELIQSDGFGVSTVSADAHIVRRSRRSIKSSETSSLIFICQKSGSGIVRQDSQNIVLEQGAITFIDSDRPYEFKFDESFEQTVLQVPKHVFLDRCRWLMGSPPIRVSGENPLAHLVQANLDTLLKVGNAIPETMSPKVFTTVVDLLSLALDESAEGPLPEISEGQLMHVQRSKHYIMQNLKESSLSPNIVAKACDISPRYLSNLFSSEGITVSGWIRMQRLESARMEIERKINVSEPLNQVAYRWGFSDYSHFCRLFKSAYGLSPRNWRNRLNPID